MMALLLLLWFIVLLTHLAIAFALPVLLVRYVPWPHPWRWRALFSVVFCWLALMAFTAFVYSPLAIVLAEMRGVENPYHGFDNNDFDLLFLLGWLLPAIPLGLWGFGRWFMRTFGDSPPTNAG